MKFRIDLTGQRLGKLVAVRPTGATTKSRNAIWECTCDCGKTATVTTGQWKARNRVSCGCSQKTQFACKVFGCKAGAKALNLCNRHYKQLKNPNQRTSEDIQERFALKTVRRENGCLEWTGTCDDFGYGQTSYEGRKHNCHRLAWVLDNGPIPDGLHVCHKCDNPKCVDVAHLFLGTPMDNVQDAIRKGRRKSCPR